MNADREVGDIAAAVEQPFLDPVLAMSAARALRRASPPPLRRARPIARRKTGVSRPYGRGRRDAGRARRPRGCRRPPSTPNRRDPIPETTRRRSAAPNPARSTGNSNLRSFSRSSRTAPIPSPPRFCRTASARRPAWPPPTGAVGLLVERGDQQRLVGELGSEAMSAASAPEPASSSARSRLAIALWRTAAPSRLFSTICTQPRCRTS
jgi:hypothetical protein